MLADVAATRELFWVNPQAWPASRALPTVPLGPADVDDAARRLERFRPYLAQVFPETAPLGGRIESALRAAPALQQALARAAGRPFPGRLLVKLDSPPAHLRVHQGPGRHLTKSSSSPRPWPQARGLLRPGDEYTVLASPAARELFSAYSVAWAPRATTV